MLPRQINFGFDHFFLMIEEIVCLKYIQLSTQFRELNIGHVLYVRKITRTYRSGLNNENNKNRNKKHF